MQSVQNGVPDLCALTRSRSRASALVALANRHKPYRHKPWHMLELVRRMMHNLLRSFHLSILRQFCFITGADVLDFFD